MTFFLHIPSENSYISSNTLLTYFPNSLQRREAGPQVGFSSKPSTPKFNHTNTSNSTTNTNNTADSSMQISPNLSGTAVARGGSSTFQTTLGK